MDQMLGKWDAALSSAVSGLMKIWAGATYWDLIGVAVLAALMIVLPKLSHQRLIGQLLNIMMILMILVAAYLCIRVLVYMA